METNTTPLTGTITINQPIRLEGVKREKMPHSENIQKIIDMVEQLPETESYFIAIIDASGAETYRRYEDGRNIHRGLVSMSLRETIKDIENYVIKP